jgi:hypothetical protein
MKASWLVRLVTIVLIVGATTLSNSIGAQGQGVAPFADYAPPDWGWWCGDEGCLLLPNEAEPGSQERFFLVTRGDRIHGEWLPGWMGGGEVTWQGPIEVAGLEWDAQLAQGNGRKGLIGISTDRAWSFAAVSLENNWEADALVYNAILRGGQDE